MRFSVDTEQLSGTAPRFGAAGVDLAAAVARLRGTLSGLGPVWGGDGEGAAFHARYEPQAERVAVAAGNVARGLGTISEGVDAMGANHAGTEAGVRSGLVVR